MESRKKQKLSPKKSASSKNGSEQGDFVLGERLPPIQGIFHYGDFVGYDQAKVVFTMDDIPSELKDFHSEAWKNRTLLKETFMYPKVPVAKSNNKRKFIKNKHCFPGCLILEAKTMHDRLCVINWWQNLSFEKQKEIIRDELSMKYYRYTISPDPIILPPANALLSSDSERDNHFMQRCIELATTARDNGNTPVGCVLVKDGIIIAEASESLPATPDIIGHAEVLAIRAACWSLQTMTLPDVTLYTTAEPCWMCSHAIREASICRVVFGTTTQFMGGATSNYPILRDRHQVPHWSPPPQITPGVMEEECKNLRTAKRK